MYPTKKRFLNPGDKVKIIYRKNQGFCDISAELLNYRKIKINSKYHRVPVLRTSDKQEVLGHTCFWVREDDIDSAKDLLIIQQNLVKIQYEASLLSFYRGIDIPEKIHSMEIANMAKQNAGAFHEMKREFGFDPLDEKWIEEELAQTTLEKKWFAFEREHRIEFDGNWENYAQRFSEKTSLKLTSTQAKELAKKRTRLLCGAYWVRLEGVKDPETWKAKALEFEVRHRSRENRMNRWVRQHKDKTIFVRTKKPIKFHPGPYFDECIERVPHVFQSPDCNFIKPGILLMVLAYDPQEKYISLDFAPEIAEKIRGNDEITGWMKDYPDYAIIVRPDQVDTHIESDTPLD